MAARASVSGRLGRRRAHSHAEAFPPARPPSGCEVAPRRQPTLTNARSASLQLFALAVVTGILVRAQPAHLVGEDQARQLQARAQERAAEHLRTLLGSRTETVA